MTTPFNYSILSSCNATNQAAALCGTSDGSPGDAFAVELMQSLRRLVAALLQSAWRCTA